MTEKVLCINRKKLPPTWVRKRTVLPMDLDTFTRQCALSGYFFENRPEAEQNPSLKQIIPYIMIQTQDTRQTAVYCRQGSEKRLHDLWSLGIGGHINPVDKTSTQGDFQTILTAGMVRELDEELIRRPTKDEIEFLGVISEDITSVGSVHLGAVFRILTPDPAAYTPGPELSRFQWYATSDLAELNMELWSELTLDLVDTVR